MTDQTQTFHTECDVEKSFLKAVSNGLAQRAIEAVREVFPAKLAADDYDTAEAKKAALLRTARKLANG